MIVLITTFFFNVSKRHGVSDRLISIIKLLYMNQTGRVDDSKRFLIDRSVKQGDFSPILFNAIMEITMRNWKNQVID